MKKLATRTAQYPLFADFAFSFNEWAVDLIDGSKKTFGSTLALSTDPLEAGLTGPVANTGLVVSAIPMPIGAVITGGNDTAAAKIEALESAGVRVAPSPAVLGPTLLEAIRG